MGNDGMLRHGGSNFERMFYMRSLPMEGGGGGGGGRDVPLQIT